MVQQPDAFIRGFDDGAVAFLVAAQLGQRPSQPNRLADLSTERFGEGVPILAQLGLVRGRLRAALAGGG